MRRRLIVPSEHTAERWRRVADSLIWSGLATREPQERFVFSENITMLLGKDLNLLLTGQTVRARGRKPRARSLALCPCQPRLAHICPTRCDARAYGDRPSQVSFRLSMETWSQATFAADQNVELRYVFAYFGPVPVTNGDPAAPSVELRIGMKSPFYKIERWDDGSSIVHAFSYGPCARARARIRAWVRAWARARMRAWVRAAD